MRFGQVMLSKERAWRSGDSDAERLITTPAALRTRLRDQPFRPLATSSDLPGGWRIDLAAPQQAHAVLETVYPGLVAAWAAQQNGQLRAESLEAVSKRQVGIFKDIHRLPQHLIESTVERVCAGCVCQPTWWHASKTERAASPAGTGLPCRSACNLWLSTAQKMGEAVA